MHVYEPTSAIVAMLIHWRLSMIVIALMSLAPIYKYVWMEELPISVLTQPYYVSNQMNQLCWQITMSRKIRHIINATFTAYCYHTIINFLLLLGPRAFLLGVHPIDHKRALTPEARTA